MINKEIMNQLKEKMPSRTVYRKIEEVRQAYGYSISKEDAAYLLAGSLMIDISKYLSIKEIERLRKINVNPIQIKELRLKSKSRSNFLILKINDLSIEISFLPKKIINDCNNMAECYQIFFFFENLMRYFILNIFKSKSNKTDWWNQAVPADIKKNVKNRKLIENKNLWHIKRGSHNIFYTDFGDLNAIIINNWDIFKEYFPNQHWITSRLKELELSRNIIAHNNPLPKKEIDRIKIYFHDIKNQIEQYKIT